MCGSHTFYILLQTTTNISIASHSNIRILSTEESNTTHTMADKSQTKPQSQKSYKEAAGEYYNQKYETWMPWMEDQYLKWFTKDNKASYATKRSSPPSSIPSIHPPLPSPPSPPSHLISSISSHPSHLIHLISSSRECSLTPRLRESRQNKNNRQLASRQPARRRQRPRGRSSG
jgi:hypothetical protein